MVWNSGVKGKTWSLMDVSKMRAYIVVIKASTGMAFLNCQTGGIYKCNKDL
jgi:hypothetical protein